MKVWLLINSWAYDSPIVEVFSTEKAAKDEFLKEVGRELMERVRGGYGEFGGNNISDKLFSKVFGDSDNWYVCLDETEIYIEEKEISS